MLVFSADIISILFKHKLCVDSMKLYDMVFLLFIPLVFASIYKWYFCCSYIHCLVTETSTIVLFNSYFIRMYYQYNNYHNDANIVFYCIYENDR